MHTARGSKFIVLLSCEHVKLGGNCRRKDRRRNLSRGNEGGFGQNIICMYYIPKQEKHFN